MAYRLCTLLLLLAVVPAARGLWLNLDASSTKCVSEKLQDNILVVGDYAAFIIPDHGDESSAVFTPISVKVTSPYGSDLHHEQNVTTGQFLFTTTESGTYEACFRVHGDHHGGKIVTVGIDWKTGILATKDHWDAVAKTENIQGLELELRKLEAAVQVVHGNLINLKNREAALRSLSELTNERIAWFSGICIGICMLVSVLQVYHLRCYLRNKRII